MARKRVTEIGIRAVRVVGSSLLAARKVAWSTAFRVLRGRRVLYLGAAPRLVPPVPPNLTENEENEALRDLCMGQSPDRPHTAPIPPPYRLACCRPVSVLTFGTSIREASSSRFSYLRLLAIRTLCEPGRRDSHNSGTGGSGGRRTPRASFIPAQDNVLGSSA